MKPATFRKIALSLPEATEGSHFSNADFRIAGKIFATLALEHQGYGVLLLTPDQQAGMIQDAPEVFSPVPGGWGEKGRHPRHPRKSSRRHPRSRSPRSLEPQSPQA